MPEASQKHGSPEGYREEYFRAKCRKRGESTEVRKGIWRKTSVLNAENGEKARKPATLQGQSAPDAETAGSAEKQIYILGLL